HPSRTCKLSRRSNAPLCVSFALSRLHFLVDPIELSSDVGLVAISLLTANALLGLLLSTKYNPVRRWPHRRINTVLIHNWTGYLALGTALLHPALLLLASRVHFTVVDLVYPVSAPKQPTINTLGALALYATIFVA